MKRIGTFAHLSSLTCLLLLLSSETKAAPREYTITNFCDRPVFVALADIKTIGVDQIGSNSSNSSSTKNSAGWWRVDAHSERTLFIQGQRSFILVNLNRKVVSRPNYDDKSSAFCRGGVENFAFHFNYEGSTPAPHARYVQECANRGGEASFFQEIAQNAGGYHVKHCNP